MNTRQSTQQNTAKMMDISFVNEHKRHKAKITQLLKKTNLLEHKNKTLNDQLEKLTNQVLFLCRLLISLMILMTIINLAFLFYFYMQNNPEFASNVNNLCAKLSMKMYELYNKSHELLYLKVLKIYEYAMKGIKKFYNYVFDYQKIKKIEKIEHIKNYPFYNVFYRLEL